MFQAFGPESVETECPNEDSESDENQSAKTQALLPKPKIKQLSTQPPTAPSKVSKTQQRSWQFQNDLKWNLILDDMHKHTITLRYLILFQRAVINLQG